MKAKWKSLTALGLAAVMAGGLVGCGGSSSDKLTFLVYGDNSEVAMYKKMAQEFNRTYGAENGIEVETVPVSVEGYANYVRSMATAKNSYNVFFADESNFKAYVQAHCAADISEELQAVTDIDTSDVFKTTVDRLRFNPATNTSNENDSLYGMPLDTKPSAIYYNETMFEQANIMIISVDEEDMDAWNAGQIADRRGHKKEDFPKLNGITVPKKGYWRSRSPYTSDVAWQAPSSDELLVFNNRIAMNWDETEDLAMIFSPSSNPNATKLYGSEYGIFTEWWFNYGWSVGGNCLQDLSGNGDWNFSLMDDTKNYIVTSSGGYVGEWTGKQYAEGETIDFNDKFELPKGEVMTPEDDGTYTYNGKTVGIRESIKQSVEAGVLGELPSIREAFVRYLRLGADKNADNLIEGMAGLNIAPKPQVFSSVGRTRQNYWYSKKMAMLIDYSTYIEIFSKRAAEFDFAWDVAPVPRYKQYKQPLDPNCDEVVIRGKEAGLSNSKAMLVRERSEKKNEAAKFICWMSSQNGQAYRAQEGWFPNQTELLDDIVYPGYAPKNVTIFAKAMEYQTVGDWWYLPDFAWIDVWANPLNYEVRNGKMSYTAWKSTVVVDTNKKLLEY